MKHMKKAVGMLFVMIMLLAAASASRAEKLVAYFSATGNTAQVATMAAELLGADLFEIRAKEPYTEADLAYYTGGRCDREQEDPSVRPEMEGMPEDLERYDTILIGYPIWHGQAPRIISTFLESGDFEGKTLAAFCTSASSPIGHSAEDLHALVPDTVTWLSGRRFPGKADGSSIQAWMDSEILPYLEAESEENEEGEDNMQGETLKLWIGNTEVQVEWEDNAAVEALTALARNGGHTVSMSRYGGFEQVGHLGQNLPREDEQTTTAAGDIVLYSGDQIVIFYGTNAWAYTRLGHITDRTPEEMRELLGGGDVTVTLRAE
ncbi:MAG: hypothetical protein IJ083_13305 [Clostridia bacterium]|nr:hypothetical protein [Clostridia bacterium]